MGTLSVFHDGQEGLPMESGWKAEIEEIRGAGKNLAEVGQFAVRDVGTSYMQGPTLDLFRLVLAHGLETSVDFYCIAVHSKHERFYRMLQFITLGNHKNYAPVQVDSAVGMSLDLEWVKKRKEHLIGRGILGKLCDISRLKIEKPS